MSYVAVKENTTSQLKARIRPGSYNPISNFCLGSAITGLGFERCFQQKFKHGGYPSLH